METTRQQRVNREIQKNVSDVFIKEAAGVIQGSLVSVTGVRISPDLSFAKIYVSVFPFANGSEMMKKLEENAWMIRKELGRRMKNQLRIVPEIAFYLDDSMEYVANIEKLLD